MTKHIVTFQHIMHEDGAVNEITKEFDHLHQAEADIRRHAQFHARTLAVDLKECWVMRGETDKTPILRPIAGNNLATTEGDNG